jgi:hypothetical protein
MRFGNVLTVTNVVASAVRGGARAVEQVHRENAAKLKDFSEPVRQTILSEAGSAPLVAVETQAQGAGDNTVYEARFRHGEDEVRIVVDPAGALLAKHLEKHERNES